MEIIAKVYKKQMPESGEKEGRTWVRQTVVLEQMDTRAQKLAVTVAGDGHVTDWLDVREGDIVRCWFEPRSREYEGKWFSELISRRVMKLTL